MNSTLTAEPAHEPARNAEPAATRAAANQFLSRTHVRVATISALVVVPCFWQSRIQAGDLSSHLYNAWLSILIGEGKAPGLKIVPQQTNVLFDLMSASLMRAVGPWAAEHIAVPLAVLVFFWGAFAMVCRVSHSRPWYVLTFLAILAHGWVFHMGFMNYYLATGLSFWAFALLWKPTPRSAMAAVPLIGLAVTAHAIPVAWMAGCLAYAWVARQIRPRARLILMVGAVGALIIIRHFLIVHFPTRWSAEQAISMTGADQISVFESKYHLLEIILLALWFSLFVRAVRRKGEERMLLGIPFQLCLIVSAAILLLPGAVLLPMYAHPLRYIAERMSLLAGVSCCALLGGVVPGQREKMATVVLMGLFFAFLYVDTRALNRVEDLMEQSVAQVPAGSRVISALCDERGDVNLLAHTIDRVCIHRCFSYANYEPATTQFRIRANGVNPVVVASDEDAAALQQGAYAVKSYDAPLYQIYLRGRYLDTRVLRAGDVTGATCFESIPGPNDLLHARRHDSN
jgi:hypothetical protein